MDPVTMMLIGGGLMQGFGSLLGARNQNKTNKQNQRLMEQRNQRLEADIRPRLGSGPSGAEDGLLQLLMGINPNAPQSAATNASQDWLMQMLRSDPFNTADLFASWEPIESRALDQSLAGAFAGSSGLGERFGSAKIREEGQIRGQAAEGAAARRQQAQMQVHESNADRQMSVAEFLANMGMQQGNQQNQLLSLLISGFQGLGGLTNQRQGMDTNLLSLLYGQPMAGASPSATPGAFGDIGQLMAMMPMLSQMMRPAPTGKVK